MAVATIAPHGHMQITDKVTPKFPVLGLHQSVPSHSPVSPALYLVGAAAEIMGVTSSLLRADNFTGIALIEVILDSEYYELTHDQLAVKISEMLYSQSDRRFAFGLLITQTTCMVYMFDHSGAVASQPFTYHQRPIQFCAIMFRMGCDKRDRLGFDQSTSFDVARREVLVRTREKSGEGSTKETFYNLWDVGYAGLLAK
ncbi:hypothetical protein JB92DRAFT_3097791 [Gautieria morchelliformis]|nr:hypothetical protein JB92DRAFT_3097791 [Gautieria morchelliformis]